MDELAQVKGRARAAWGAGDFTPFARMLEPSRVALVEKLGIGPGDEVLDVGCGTGELAVQAAQAGATVTGLDLAPEMLVAARAAAAEAGVEVRWIEGDAEDLPAASASVDVVVSSFGCMFAPRHAVTARELARVLRPGGRVGILTWPVGSAVAEFLRTASSHMPPPPPIAEPPLLWGDEGHVREIFAGTGVALSFETGTLSFPFESVDEAIDAYTARFGPLVVARALLEPQGRWQALVDDLTAFFERRTVAETGATVLTTDYMLVLGRAPG